VFAYCRGGVVTLATGVPTVVQVLPPFVDLSTKIDAQQ